VSHALVNCLERARTLMTLIFEDNKPIFIPTIGQMSLKSYLMILLTNIASRSSVLEKCRCTELRMLLDLDMGELDEP